jgi:transcriptional regulator with XRE-family HTH domain
MARAKGWTLPYLHAWRQYRVLSVTELSAKSGIALSLLSRLEHEKSRAGVQSIDRLCAALDITRGQLLHECPATGQPHPAE